ncbi:MAG: transglycosylase SLT domain-containing protein [Fretibacterium sp.]|nr:transglycosylase SLT domain-containing protein [Fretibacterium sp.]
MRKKLLFLCGLYLLCLFWMSFFTPLKAEGAQTQTLEGLFWERSWEKMDVLYASKKDLKPQDHTLMANALRMRGKWPEAVAIMEKVAPSLPDSVRPYADMTLLLGFEKQGRASEALALVEKLWKKSPPELKYYAASAQFRLLKEASAAKKQGALKRMLQTANTEHRKSYVLGQLLKLPGDRREEALQLLELQAGNKAAAQTLFKAPKPWSASVSLALGVYAHTVKDDATAIPLLASVPASAKGGRKAIYYRGSSLYRQKRYAEALQLWTTLALKGNAYSESAIRRLATMAEEVQKEQDACINVLRRVAKERKGKVQARAMQLLRKFVDSAEKEKLETQLLQAYPNTTYAFDVLWARGWDCWKAGDSAGSAHWWKIAYAPGISSSHKARVLYWLAAAQKASGKSEESERTLAKLAHDHPLSFYTFTASPGAVTLQEGSNPVFKTQPLELESWGFVYYAKLHLERQGASSKELYRALELARWLGSEDVYQLARLFTGHFTQGTKLFRTDLEALYPRPFKKEVEAAAKTYKVEDLFIWSVMRQESAFKPRATSWVGASGLMQLMPATAKDEAKRMGLAKYDIYNVRDNIMMGASHLAWLNKSFARQDWIMAAYNAGSGNARKWLKGNKDMTPVRWIEEVRFRETCDYVQKVSANLAVYRMLYGEERGAEDERAPELLENFEGDEDVLEGGE